MKRVLIPFEISHRAPPVGQTLHYLQGLTMGTTWSVQFALPADRAVATVERGIQQQLETVIEQMSTWVNDSYLSCYNRAEADSWHDLPTEFFRVVKYALSVAEATSGAYDPTIGSLVNLWGFGPGCTASQRPTKDALQLARARVGWQSVQLDTRTQRLLQPGGIYLDLSAIAKGFAVDQVSRYLQQHGVEHHLVEIGGELRGAGIKPDARPWWVALEHPTSFGMESSDLVDTVIALHGLSVATSGDYRRYFATADGNDAALKRYSHTIDPRTGEPIQHGLAAVTVVHVDCMAADALSTALNVMGVQQGMEFAQRHSLAALFVERAAGGLKQHVSSAFAALMQ